MPSPTLTDAPVTAPAPVPAPAPAPVPVPATATATKANSPRTLTPLQLAVARAFAKGGRTLAIAAAFQINRRTLSRWQRLAEFRDEIVAVHRALSQPPPRLAPSAQLQPNEREFLNHVYTSAMKQFMKI